MNCESESEIVVSVPEEVPSKSIDAINEEKGSSLGSTFSPIKFVENTEIVDEEITISLLARKANCANVEGETEAEQCANRLQRKNDEEIFNTPKRERRFEDQTLNVRRSRDTKTEAESEEFPKTPQKSGRNNNELVKSLSMEFEQRLASIHVSPKIQSSAPRSMSPVRCVAELSPVSKLNFNEEINDTGKFVIEEPKLISPSKIVAAASAIEIEKIRVELDSKVGIS